MKIVESKGDVLKVKADLICHQVNCLGVMGAGLAKQVKEQYPQVYKEYVSLVKCCNKDNERLLGEVQFCYLNEYADIANIFGQEGVGTGVRQTDYEALKSAFAKVHDYIIQVKTGKAFKMDVVAIPKYFGCGLAGGDWDTVLGIITDALNDLDITLEIVEFAK